VEGAFVVWHEGKYYCFYSGGAWHTEDYGVGCAVADTVLGPYRDLGNGPSVLGSVPGHVFGPGHNSVTRGPDGQTEYLVYHAWDAAHTARRMCIDRLLWTPEGPRCDGPTWTAQTINL
jgi:GH43 family beta-xylosidase